MHKQLLVGALLVYPILMYIQYYASDRGSAIHGLGIACATLSVLAYGSPLASLVSEFLCGMNRYFIQLFVDYNISSPFKLRILSVILSLI